MKSLLALFFLLSLPLQAVTESDLSYLWRTEIIPHFEQMQKKSFINPKGLRIRYYHQTQTDNKKVLVILPGRTEASINYAELIYDLKDSGFDIFIIDHQGQGISDRILRDRLKGYVFNFSDYVQDLTQLMNEVIIPHSAHKSLYLYAHSMGGAIASFYMSQNEGVFKRAILSAPMMQINTHPMRETTARRAILSLMKMRKATDYLPGARPFNPDEIIFEENNQTHSRERFESIKSLLDDYADHVVWSPTVRWTFEALRVTQNIHLLGPLIKTPILLLQASKDETVRPNRQNQFCRNSENCKILKLAGSFHQPMLEVDKIRNRAIKEIKTFFQ